MDKKDLQFWKVAVVGCGAVGSFYGSKIAQSGINVHFLLRSDFETVAADGLHIQSIDGNYSLHPNIYRYPEEIGKCDLVLIALKSTANDIFSNLLKPLVGKQTALFTLQNGLGNEAALAKIFPQASVFGGMCFVCLNRTAPGVVKHIAHGKIVMGRHNGLPDALTKKIAQLVQNAGIQVEVAGNLEKAKWEKLIWNIPFNGLGVAGTAGLDAVINGCLKTGQPIGPCLSSDRLLDKGLWENLVTELMDEVISIGRALGHDISLDSGEYQRNRTRVMGSYRASTLIDFDAGRPLELEALFYKPLATAHAKGIKAPRLTRLCSILNQLVNQNPSRSTNK
ncbi:MAG: 2-dehydropantoate 2-reductase [Verrucomicrobiales bacterium]|nr:2-dehydropantoate 2-reductase [Verrucomicrobiales bacterium]